MHAAVDLLLALIRDTDLVPKTLTQYILNNCIVDYVVFQYQSK